MAKYRWCVLYDGGNPIKRKPVNLGKVIRSTPSMVWFHAIIGRKGKLLLVPKYRFRLFHNANEMTVTCALDSGKSSAEIRLLVATVFPGTKPHLFPKH
jgi:hypothetical protein